MTRVRRCHSKVVVIPSHHGCSMPTCPRCPDGPSFNGQASSLQRRFGDTDDPPEPLQTEYSPLADVLDWLQRSDVGDHSTFSALPTADPYFQANCSNGGSSGYAAGTEASGASSITDSATRQKSFSSTLAYTGFGQADGEASSSAGGDTHRSLPNWTRPVARNRDDIGDMPASTICATAVGCPANGTEQQLWTQEEDEEDEWAQRQARTGTVGRLVQYAENEKPRDDFLLRGGCGRHVVVAAVRDGGPASKVGVKAGDRLSSIDGNKEFRQLPTDTIREQLTAPTVLVFLGFVGKLQAEVRLSCSDRVCGLTAQQSAVMQREKSAADSRFAICEETVFNSSSASLFLTASAGHRGKFPNSSCRARPVHFDIDEALAQGKAGGTEDANASIVFELQRGEALGILRRALEGPAPPIECQASPMPGSFKPQRPPPLGSVGKADIGFESANSTPVGVGGVTDKSRVALLKSEHSPSSLVRGSSSPNGMFKIGENSLLGDSRSWITPAKASRSPGGPHGSPSDMDSFEGSPHGPSLLNSTFDAGCEAEPQEPVSPGGQSRGSRRSTPKPISADVEGVQVFNERSGSTLRSGPGVAPQMRAQDTGVPFISQEREDSLDEEAEATSPRSPTTYDPETIDEYLQHVEASTRRTTQDIAPAANEPELRLPLRKELSEDLAFPPDLLRCESSISESALLPDFRDTRRGNGALVSMPQVANKRVLSMEPLSNTESF